MRANRLFVVFSYVLKMLQQEAATAKTNTAAAGAQAKCGVFKMPLHYPRYKKADYETMPEWKLDSLLAEYGLPVFGDVSEKRRFAMGAFSWEQ